MDDRTLTALKGSIAKWEAIVSGTGADEGSANCPLCEQFIEDNCHGCPISSRTHMEVCIGTPYGAWCRHLTDNHGPGAYMAGKIIPDCPDCKRLAQAELDFLRSLLPAGESA